MSTRTVAPYAGVSSYSDGPDLDPVGRVHVPVPMFVPDHVVAVVLEPIVMGAQRAAVAWRGRPDVLPVGGMIDVVPEVTPAAGPDTSSSLQQHCRARRADKQALFAAHVDHYAGRIHDDPADVADHRGGDRVGWIDDDAGVRLASTAEVGAVTRRHRFAAG